MLKNGTAVGVVLTLAGIISGCWPVADNAALSRQLVDASTYELREEVVVVDWPATTVRDASGATVSIPAVLRAAGCWVRRGRQFITRERLEVAGVLVVNRLPDDTRTATLVRRWVSAGGTMLVLTAGQGGPSDLAVGSGRIVVLDPASLEGVALAARLLDEVRKRPPSSFLREQRLFRRGQLAFLRLAQHWIVQRQPFHRLRDD